MHLKILWFLTVTLLPACITCLVVGSWPESLFWSWMALVGVLILYLTGIVYAALPRAPRHKDQE